MTRGLVVILTAHQSPRRARRPRALGSARRASRALAGDRRSKESAVPVSWRRSDRRPRISSRSVGSTDTTKERLIMQANAIVSELARLHSSALLDEGDPGDGDRHPVRPTRRRRVRRRAGLRGLACRVVVPADAGSAHFRPHVDAIWSAPGCSCQYPARDPLGLGVAPPSVRGRCPRPFGLRYLTRRFGVGAVLEAAGNAPALLFPGCMDGRRAPPMALDAAWVNGRSQIPAETPRGGSEPSATTWPADRLHP
jgi:hypothetical protein